MLGVSLELVFLKHLVNPPVWCLLVGEERLRDQTIFEVLFEEVIDVKHWL